MICMWMWINEYEREWINVKNALKDVWEGDDKLYQRELSWDFRLVFEMQKVTRDIIQNDKGRRCDQF